MSASKPWFDDHVYCDTDLIRRWSGHDVDLTRPLPSDLIVVAVQADPDLITLVGPFLAMLTLPGILDAAQARARHLRRRLAPAHFPGRAELADLVTAAARPHSRQADAVPRRGPPRPGPPTPGSQHAA